MNRPQIITYSFLLMACSHPMNDNNSTKRDVMPEQKAVAEMKEPADSSNCETATNIDAYLQEINITPRKFINGQVDDNCVLAIVKAISDKSISTGEDKYLEALNAICGISDGYLSEYLLEIGTYQLYDNFQKLTEYLVAQGSSSCLRRVIIESVSMEMSVGGELKTAEINRYLDSRLEESGLSEERASFIKEMRKEFDPSMFD